MKVTDRVELMTGALNVMNRAIQRNSDHFPYKEICALGRNLIGGKNLGVAVYAEDPDTPHDYFTIRWNNDQLELVSHGKEDPSIAWKVPESYLRDVVQNPEVYIEHPAKLDSEWLKQRLGIPKRASEGP